MWQTASTSCRSSDGEGDGQQCRTVVVQVDKPDTGLHCYFQTHLRRFVDDAALLQRAMKRSSATAKPPSYVAYHAVLTSYTCGRKSQVELYSYFNILSSCIHFLSISLRQV